MIETISKNDVLVDLICDKYANYGIYSLIFFYMWWYWIVIQRCILGANEDQMKKNFDFRIINQIDFKIPKEKGLLGLFSNARILDEALLKIISNLH